MIIEKATILKVNGFSKGLNLYQIFSYITLLVQTFLFSFLLVPEFSHISQIVLPILYYLSISLTAIFGYKATVIDPTDELVYYERKCRLEGKPFDERMYPFQCDYCETSVNETSKHCRSCNRCVQDFDHHCIWVNNCISKKNYRAFFIATVSLSFSSGLFAVTGILFVIDYYSRTLRLIDDVAMQNEGLQTYWKPILMAIFSLISGIFSLMSLRLIVFHLYLIRNKISTYDFITRKRNEKGAQKKTKKTKEMKLARVTPTLINKNKELEVQEHVKDLNRAKDERVQEYKLNSERQVSERGTGRETYATLHSGTITRRESQAFPFDKNFENKEIIMDYKDPVKEESGTTDLEKRPSLNKSAEQASDPKWKFQVFPNHFASRRYTNLSSSLSSPTQPDHGIVKLDSGLSIPITNEDDRDKEIEKSE